MPCSPLDRLPTPFSDKKAWPVWSQYRAIEARQQGNAYPRITIITPSLNNAIFLEDTIRSVLSQGYPNLEYIIIDGGSTDGSLDLIKKYQTWIDYWLSEKDEGQANAINKGISVASGELIGWLNSDDVLAPCALYEVADLYQTNQERGITMGGVTIVSAEGRPLWTIHPYGVTLPNMIKIWEGSRMQFVQPGSFAARSVWQRVGLLDMSLRYVFDREWMCRALGVTQVNYSTSVLACFRLHEDSKTVKEAHSWEKEHWLVTERFLGKLKDVDRNYAEAETILCHRALIHLGGGTGNYDRTAAFSALIESVKRSRKIFGSRRFWWAFVMAVLPEVFARWLRQLTRK